MTGDITQKGYEKKKTRLLAPYVKQAQESKYISVFVCVRVRELHYLSFPQPHLSGPLKHSHFAEHK